MRFIAMIACLTWACPATASDAVRRKMLQTYFNGVTAELATRVITTDPDKAALAGLLSDDSFSRQVDN